MKENKLIIAAAGSGKTTLLVKEALARNTGRVLITTYTLANELEIRKKIIGMNGYIPKHIAVQTWFSFLLQHGVKPFQGCLFQKGIKGMLFVESVSGIRAYSKAGPIFYNESEIEGHYLSPSHRIFSDKLSKFTVRANEKSEGAVIDRLSRIYSDIFIDEVQDLAGYDLEFIKGLFNCSSNILLVGDPRQATYSTHHEKKLSQYSDGRIKEFIQKECPANICTIDETSLNKSHRCNAPICDFSAKLYPQFTACEPNGKPLTGHDGIFLIKPSDAKSYLEKYAPFQLRNDRKTEVNLTQPVMNFGESKGLSFDRTLIYPTKVIVKYLRDGNLKKTVTKKTPSGQKKTIVTDAFDIAKFYVAITRARHSVGVICDYGDEAYIEGMQKFRIEADKEVEQRQETAISGFTKCED